MDNKQEHESYGMVSISNISCNKGQPLFGSSINHDRWIELRINTANVERSLSQEWFHPKRRIIEIALSSAQFAELITTPNTMGVPCTINYAEGKDKESPPYMGQNEVFADELKEDFNEALIKVQKLQESAQKLLTRKGTIKAQEKKSLLSDINMLVQHIKSNIPFLHKQFTRAMNKTVNSAKIEIDSFYTNIINKLGKQTLDKLNKPEIEYKEK